MYFDLSVLQLSQLNLLELLKEEGGLLDNIPGVFSAVNFVAGNATHAKTLNPFTHVYMFDLSYTPDDHVAIARAFHSRYGTTI